MSSLLRSPVKLGASGGEKEVSSPGCPVEGGEVPDLHS